MTEVFMVNYAHTSNLKDWHCQLATESLMIAQETAQRLRVQLLTCEVMKHITHGATNERAIRLQDRVVRFRHADIYSFLSHSRG